MIKKYIITIENNKIIDIQEYKEKKVKEIKKEIIAKNKDSPKVEYGDQFINEIIKFLEDINNGIIETKIKETRYYANLLKIKIKKAKGFIENTGNYYNFLMFLYQNSDNYKKHHFSNIKKIYYNIASIINSIKINNSNSTIKDI